MIYIKMIRLSDLTALDILSEKSIDPNTNKIHLYEIVENNRTNSQIILGDNYPVEVITRKFGMCTFMNNTLLGTSNFYPEQGLEITNYHQNSQLEILMNKQVLPLLEFKKARLYFSQGVLGDPNINGHWIRVYIKREDLSEITLTSFVDLKESSNALAVPPKYWESQIYNEAIDFEFLDLDYLLNSGIPEVNEIRDFLLEGTNPLTYYIEYGTFTDNGVDNYNVNGYEFTRISPSIINQHSLLIGDGNDGLFASVKLDNDGFYLNSRLYHQKFDIVNYMDQLKNPGESYEIQYIFQVDSYKDSQLVNQEVQKILMDNFDQVKYRPVIIGDVDYANVSLMIRVRNINTSMVFRRDSQIIIPIENINNFKPVAALNINLSENPVKKIVNRQVNKILTSNETPKIVQVEKRVFVQMNELENINLLEGNFITQLNLHNDVTGYSKLYLKIGTLLFENIQQGIPIFEISENAYQEQVNRYILLDQDMKAITSGKIVKS